MELTAPRGLKVIKKIDCMSTLGQFFLSGYCTTNDIRAYSRRISGELPRHYACISRLSGVPSLIQRSTSLSTMAYVCLVNPISGSWMMDKVKAWDDGKDVLVLLSDLRLTLNGMADIRWLKVHFRAKPDRSWGILGACTNVMPALPYLVVRNCIVLYMASYKSGR